MVQIIEENNMKPEQFCYWLRGFLEIAKAGLKEGQNLELTREQIDMIDKHLLSVFNNVIMTQQPNIVITPAPNLQPHSLDPQVWPYGTGTPMPKPPYTIECSSNIGAGDNVSTIIC